MDASLVGKAGYLAVSVEGKEAGAPREHIWKEDEVIGALGMGTRAACVGSWLCLVPLLFPSPPEVLIRQVQGASLIPHVSPGAVLGTLHP